MLDIYGSAQVSLQSRHRHGEKHKDPERQREIVCACECVRMRMRGSLEDGKEVDAAGDGGESQRRARGVMPHMGI